MFANLQKCVSKQEGSKLYTFQTKSSQMQNILSATTFYKLCETGKLNDPDKP